MANDLPYIAASSYLNAAPLCYSFVYGEQKDRCTFLFYEKYADANAFDRHGKTSAIQELFRVLQPLLDGAPSIELYDEVT